MDTTDLLTLLQRDTHLKRVASTYGGEYAGACPFYGGQDRFRVWPDHPGGVGRCGAGNATAPATPPPISSSAACSPGRRPLLFDVRRIR